MAPADPTTFLADVGPGSIALIVDEGVTTIDPTGVPYAWDAPGCLSPDGVVSGDRLLIACERDGAPFLTTVSLAGDGGVQRSWWAELPDLVTAGSRYFVACPAAADAPTGECEAFLADDGEKLATLAAIPAPEPGDMTSAIGDLLVFGRGEERHLIDLADGGRIVREGTADETWGAPVRLADGTVALAVELDTGGSDTRPEEIVYVEPSTGERLDYDDGADHNSLFGVGPDVIRVAPDLNVQKSNVRAFRADGTALWALDDPTVRATGSDGRVWLYETGSALIREIDPATGETVETLGLPGDVLRDFEAVQAHGDWLVARVDGVLGDALVVVRV